MKRREFLGAVAGAAAAWPAAVCAQQSGRQRLVGMLLPATASDPEFQARVGAFLQGLQQLGWTTDRSVRIEYRWAEGNPDNARKLAGELVALAPDVILADGGGAVGGLLQITRSIPIVFPVAGDPVGAGFVENLARPGGNVTGFMNFEYSTSAKWLELLEQIAPGVARVAVLRDPALPSGIGQYGVIQATAAALRVEVNPVNVREVRDIESGLANLAQRPNGALIVTANPSAIMHRTRIIDLAGRHKLPAVYFESFFAKSGGLISYGPDIVDQYRRAAGYVDRILKGEKPADLPVQMPTKLEMVINLKTAKALGIMVPQSLLASANEVIE